MLSMLALALVPVLAGCGYRMGVPNARLPEGLASVRVPIFENRTPEPQVAAFLTQALREQFQRAGVLGGEGASGLVEGVVLSVTAGPFLGAPERGNAPTYRMTATVQLTLKKGERTLNRVVVSGSEDFPSGADLLLTEANRAAALRRLAQTLMHDGAEQLASGW